MFRITTQAVKYVNKKDFQGKVRILIGYLHICSISTIFFRDMQVY